MARRRRATVPPPLELLCLKALWQLEEGNVKDVRRIVAQTRPLAYTTIMTVLDRLVRKGRLTRRKLGRAFVYAPQDTRDALRRAAVRELLEDFFNGSEEELLRFSAGARHAGRTARVRARERFPDRYGTAVMQALLPVLCFIAGFAAGVAGAAGRKQETRRLSARSRPTRSSATIGASSISQKPRSRRFANRSTRSTPRFRKWRKPAPARMPGSPSRCAGCSKRRRSFAPRPATW